MLSKERDDNVTQVTILCVHIYTPIHTFSSRAFSRCSPRSATTMSRRWRLDLCIYIHPYIYLVVGRRLDALQGARRRCHAGDDMIYVYIYTHTYIFSSRASSRCSPRSATTMSRRWRYDLCIYIHPYIYIFSSRASSRCSPRLSWRQCHAGDDVMCAYIYTHIYIFSSRASSGCSPRSATTMSRRWRYDVCMHIYTPIHIYLVVGRLLDALQG